MSIFGFGTVEALCGSGSPGRRPGSRRTVAPVPETQDRPPVDFDDSAAVAARMDARLMHLTVVAVRPLTPTLVRVELEGEGLRGLTAEAGQDSSAPNRPGFPLRDLARVL